MFRRAALREAGVERKSFLKVFTLLFNTFTWYYATLLVFTGNFTSDPQEVFKCRAFYFTAGFTSASAGVLISERVKRHSLLRFWILLGVIANLLPLIIGNIDEAQAILTFSLLGVSFGFGMPSCFAYFAEATTSENRGWVSGATYFASGISALPIALLLGSFNLQVNLVILAAWRGLAILFLFLPKLKEPILAERKQTSFKSVFQNRSFLLYLIPWCMFSLIDIFEKTILKGIVALDQFQTILLMQPLLSGVAAFVGGFFADRIGRKRIVMYGFVSLGIAYAIIGITPQTMLISWYSYFIIDSIATGMLWITLILVLWGDLSQPGAGEKYYLIGSAPFLLTEVIPLILVVLIPEVTTRDVIPAYTAFSVASFFLFTAVLPLMYAPETLSMKKIELRRLKGYVEQAKKLTEKYEEKRSRG